MRIPPADVCDSRLQELIPSINASKPLTAAVHHHERGSERRSYRVAPRMQFGGGVELIRLVRLAQLPASRRLLGKVAETARFSSRSFA
jgi:hypothetical protein